MKKHRFIIVLMGLALILPLLGEQAHAQYWVPRKTTDQKKQDKKLNAIKKRKLIVSNHNRFENTEKPQGRDGATDRAELQKRPEIDEEMQKRWQQYRVEERQKMKIAMETAYDNFENYDRQGCTPKEMQAYKAIKANYDAQEEYMRKGRKRKAEEIKEKIEKFLAQEGNASRVSQLYAKCGDGQNR